MRFTINTQRDQFKKILGSKELAGISFLSMQSNPLVDVNAAKADVILDARFRLNDPQAGRRLFEEGHIPGAAFVDLKELSGVPNGKNGRHPLPSRAELKDDGQIGRAHV